MAGAKSSVEANEGSVEKIEADIKDSALKTPRDGRVQYRVAQPGEVVPAGRPVLSLVDLSDVYMTFFLPTAYAGNVSIGEEARLILDAAPQYVIPAYISFISDVAQFTPKSVETATEREKLMFRIKAQIPKEFLKEHIAQIKTGLPGVAYLRLDPEKPWPDYLQINKNRAISSGKYMSVQPQTTSPPIEPVVRISGVTLRYGNVTALDAVDLDIPAGCTVGMIGPDGVGKSSLLSLIAGTREIQIGKVMVFGGDMSDKQYRETLCPKIAYMPQGLGKNLYPTLSVFENVDFFGRLFGLDCHERKQRIDQLLRATGLSPFADRPAGKLSGGMKQKLGVCCALIHDPDILILDEPTTGVDPLSRRIFLGAYRPHP